MPNLSELEEHLLHRLASATVTRSSVALAAELWDGDNSPFTFDMVRWVLKDMNVRGLVTYFVGGRTAISDNTMNYETEEIPVQIRVTDVGYDLLGYTQRHAIIQGTRRRYNHEDIRHPGDRTDFRTHRESAEWSPCERMSLIEHLRHYPDHPHSEEWGYQEEPMNTQQRLDSLGRPYNAPTGIGARGANADEIQRVMNERHVSVGAARDIVRARIADEIVAANPVPANQKAKILASLLKDGKAQTVADLRKRLLKDNFYIDPHNLVHVLWSIQKDAHITFRQRRQSPVAWEGDMTSIRLNTAGTKAAQKMLNGAAKAAGEVAMAEVRANTKNLVQSSRIGTGRLDEKAGKVATGGPIEREFQPRELTDSEQPIEVPIETAVVMIQDEHMPPTDDRYIDSETVEEILAEGKRLLSDSETFLAKARSTHEPPIDFFVEYPLIGKMLNRQSRIESAAKILEEEGELDLAAQTLEKITYSPFEREVLRLVQKMNA